VKATLLCILVFLTVQAHSDNRTYKSLVNLTDDESHNIRIENKQAEYNLTQPENDYLDIDKPNTELFQDCKKERAKLIFYSSASTFISTCNKAFENGVADAGFILGHELINGEWLELDFNKGINYLERASEMGSREAKRSLINTLTQQHNPKRNLPRALELAIELAESGNKWDTYISASLHAAHAPKAIANESFNSLVRLAGEGYKNVAVSAALAKIKYGNLHSLDEAKAIISSNDIQSDRHYAFLPVMIDIMEEKNVSAREKLKECSSFSYTCHNLYLNFLIYGIGGPKDLYQANILLESGFKRWPKTNANNYAWAKATTLEAPIYDPKAALEALKHIPESRKSSITIKDTIASVYAANGMFDKAIRIQEEICKTLNEFNIPDDIYKGQEKLSKYQNSKRWINTRTSLTFLNELKGFNDINNTQVTLANL